MGDYVVYHNEKKMGYKLSSSNRGYYQILTSKSVESLPGTTIWLIEGRKLESKRHKDYYLSERFVVDEVDHDDDKNYAFGKEGTSYRPEIHLNRLDWFPAFRKRMANFSVGMQKLRSEDVENFRKATRRRGRAVEIDAAHKPKVPPQKSRTATPAPRLGASHPGSGQGFCDSKTIRQVDAAAMKYVKALLRKEGWVVTDKSEELGLGYDLLCKKGRKVLHVEVKGTQGSAQVFFLKASQMRQAKVDSNFFIYLVTGVFTNKPTCTSYTGKELMQWFKFEPTEYRVSLNTTATEQLAQQLRS